MKISLVIPDINVCPTGRPRCCRYCGEAYLHGHGTVTKPVRDHKLKEAVVRRYKCVSCAKSFRDYPPGSQSFDEPGGAERVGCLVLSDAAGASSRWNPDERATCRVIWHSLPAFLKACLPYQTPHALGEKRSLQY